MQAGLFGLALLINKWQWYREDTLSSNYWLGQPLMSWRQKYAFSVTLMNSSRIVCTQQTATCPPLALVCMFRASLILLQREDSNRITSEGFPLQHITPAILSFPWGEICSYLKLKQTTHMSSSTWHLKGAVTPGQSWSWLVLSCWLALVTCRFLSFN